MDERTEFSVAVVAIPLHEEDQFDSRPSKKMIVHRSSKSMVSPDALIVAFFDPKYKFSKAHFGLLFGDRHF
jgi:hypothetical protein